jgi:chemotaxis protein CheY-P-specific phosphatase CheC
MRRMVTVITADDSEYARDILKIVLSEHGHEVIGEASNGTEAITLYKKLKPDVILLDIVMQEGNLPKTGIDTLKEIIAYDPQANIIICSALDEQTLIKESLKAGAKAFITKPFEPEKLQETLIMCTDLSVFSEIGNIGAGQAATVLSKLAQQPIHVSLPKLETGPVCHVAKLCGPPDREVTTVHMRLISEPNCDALLVLDPQEAKKIADIMTEKSTPPLRSEITQSAIEELGSIMICAFFSAIANFSEMTIIPSRPEVVTDSFEATIDIFLANQTIEAKSVLIFQVSFKRKKSSANGYLLMIPSTKFREQLINAGKKWIENSDDQSELQNSPLESQIY